MQNFLDYYDLYSSTDNIVDVFKEDPINKTCRFCGKSHPQVSFKTIPHILPELFGKNRVTSNFECDDCNEKFQKYESDMSTMIQHYLTLLNIKTKKGVPTFQSQKSKHEYSTVLKSLNNQREFNFGTNVTDFEFNEEEKKLIVNFRTRKFSPYSVYKVFLKMGISLLKKDELEANCHYLDFLNSETPIRNGMQMWTIFRYMQKTKYFLKPKVNLYRAKSTLTNGEVLPEYSMTINFANIIFQFFLPMSKKNLLEHKSDNRIKFELFPSFLFEDINKLKSIEIYEMDLDKVDKISINDEVTLYYKERIRSKN